MRHGGRYIGNRRHVGYLKDMANVGRRHDLAEGVGMPWKRPLDGCNVHWLLTER